MQLSNYLCALLLSLFLASPIMAEKLEPAADGSWVSIGGTVVSTDSTGFELDYGTGLARVRMSDRIWSNGDQPIFLGDEVRVNGTVEHGPGEKKVIEADSVYVKGLNTYFSVSDDISQPMIDREELFQLTGRIVSVEDRQFTMNLGDRKVQVDIRNLPYNPLDDKGYQQLKEGDVVQVTGELMDELFEAAEIKAETVTTVRRGQKK